MFSFICSCFVLTGAGPGVKPLALRKDRSPRPPGRGWTGWAGSGRLAARIRARQGAPSEP